MSTASSAQTLLVTTDCDSTMNLAAGFAAISVWGGEGRCRVFRAVRSFPRHRPSGGLQ
jgi:hypothetical protein